MENGDCTILGLSKLNWSKVSAIRDFPVGCGAFVSGIVPECHCQTAVTRRCFPQRIVLAVRDFPASCGRNNASHPKKSARRKEIFSLENKCMGQQDMAVDVKKATSIDAAKHVENNIQIGYACNIKLEGMKSKKRKLVDIVHAESGVGPSSGTQSVLKSVSEKHFFIPKDSANHSKNPLLKRKGNDARMKIWKKKNSLYPCGNIKGFTVGKKSRGFNANGPPFARHNGSIVTRSKVRETLRLFQAVCRKLLREEESKSTEPPANARRRIDLEAAKTLKEQGKHVNAGKQILGSVPGVEIGDEFQYRIELNIVGLHKPSQGGIDYVKHNGKILATSIVASGGYGDELDHSDDLIYTGQGGNVTSTKNKEPEDQKLHRGNLALKNSLEEETPIRVILGSESMDRRFKRYVYNGLYTVKAYWKETGPHGKDVYRFRLRRNVDQPELAWKEVRKFIKFKNREGLCVHDISDGKELIPICAVNTIDHETTPPFKYVTSMIYPDWCNPLRPKGCDCTNGCSNSQACSCTVKNGGVIPFNHNGAIVEAKPLVYECGPSCKCASTCPNRVSQHGIKFQLEIFKTETRGWGVRSLNSIPSGSFICEYIGELLSEEEAEARVGHDEYLFDIGNNSNNNHTTLWGGLSIVMPNAWTTSCEAMVNDGFTIDAAQYGNVGRFINHSCSPNLYAQNILNDHDDKKIPHIMLFAAENIPPLQELTYDYNYKIGQVYDSNGNIKKKECYCGSVGCRGRMY